MQKWVSKSNEVQLDILRNSIKLCYVRLFVSLTAACFFRDKDCPRDDFVFYSQRLMRILIEKAMSLLPFEVSNHELFHILLLLSSQVLETL